MPSLMQNIEDNYKQWKLFEQQGIHTLNDIKAKQLALREWDTNKLSQKIECETKNKTNIKFNFKFIP